MSTYNILMETNICLQKYFFVIRWLRGDANIDLGGANLLVLSLELPENQNLGLSLYLSRRDEHDMKDCIRVLTDLL